MANNHRIGFSWTPNDNYFGIPVNVTSAGKYQWGMRAMNFPAAWDITLGNAYVGAVDSGLLNGVAPYDLAANFRTQFSTDVAYSATLAFHGTHVLGIIGATANNATGVAGACPNCSVGIVRYTGAITTDAAAGIAQAVERGFQVVNFSSTAINPGVPEYSCSYSQPVCNAIAFADSRDVVFVAAAGNEGRSAPGFPANQPSVLSVAGAQNLWPSVPTSWGKWTTTIGIPGTGYFWGTHSAGLGGVIAPAKSIVSTVPANVVYNSQPAFLCGDGYNLGALIDESGVANDGYGSCTGTSMAAPHVSALAGLVRSINPRLSSSLVKSLVRNAGSNASSPNADIGYGMPNALSAANAALQQTSPSRLTPLFALHSAGRKDRFYTSVPQMAAVAISATLEPRRPNTIDPYVPSGSQSITGYSSFPGVSGTPKADVWVFTTSANPKSASVPLVPLYRLSWKCGDTTPAPPAVCASTPNHIDTTYTADPVGVGTYQIWGYKLDGIEGYIYPKTMSPQPIGTVRLMRKYNPTLDDHAIFPESTLSAMTALGYTQNSGSDWLGYVYPNLTGTIPAIQ